jgi:type II secretory pathway pseudopilin PulG
MSKSFTLIELMVTVGIVILIAALSGPALNVERNRSNLDAATQQIRDAIAQTQTYALAPERPEATGYVFVLNIGSTDQNYGTPTSVILAQREYGIFVMVGTNRINIKRGKINQPVTISSNSTGYLDSNLFKIHFRTTDFVAGCSNCYYDSSPPCVWSGSSSTCHGESAYAELETTLGSTKILKINKITGETEIL